MWFAAAPEPDDDEDLALLLEVTWAWHEASPLAQAA
jgi:hypothetical protein